MLNTVYVFTSTTIAIIVGCLILISPAFKFTESIIIDANQSQEITILDNINKLISDDLRELSKSRFFRIFKVDIDAHCMFWGSDSMCVTNTCGLKYCQNVEIDEDWHIGTTIYPFENSINETENKLIDVLTDRSKFKFTSKNPLLKKTNEEFEKHINSKWIDLEDTHHDAHFVDIEQNPESFTGYNGTKHDIWKMIYKENVLNLKLSENAPEKDILLKLVSGIHTNTNMHICKFYSSVQTSECQTNHTRYVNTVGRHRDRIENLYFTYAFVLSALSNIQNDAKEYNYIQGNIKEDNEIRKSIAQVFADLKEASFVPLTDKDLVKTMKKQRFVDIIQPTFLNITRLINCVSCEKCKLHSKIEFNGLSAAMKILFPERNELYLSRNELVGLVSLISKLSDSITWYKDWLDFERQSKMQGRMMQQMLFVLTVFLYLCGLLMLPLGQNTNLQWHKDKDKKM